MRHHLGLEFRVEEIEPMATAPYFEGVVDILMVFLDQDFHLQQSSRLDETKTSKGETTKARRKSSGRYLLP